MVLNSLLRDWKRNRFREIRRHLHPKIFVKPLSREETKRFVSSKQAEGKGKEEIESDLLDKGISKEDAKQYSSHVIKKKDDGHPMQVTMGLGIIVLVPSFLILDIFLDSILAFKWAVGIAGVVAGLGAGSLRKGVIYALLTEVAGILFLLVLKYRMFVGLSSQRLGELSFWDSFGEAFLTGAIIAGVTGAVTGAIMGFRKRKEN
jgi:hypothetical protein